MRDQRHAELVGARLDRHAVRQICARQLRLQQRDLPYVQPDRARVVLPEDEPVDDAAGRHMQE
jgi:hypothetical protein